MSEKGRTEEEREGSFEGMVFFLNGCFILFILKSYFGGGGFPGFKLKLIITVVSLSW